MKHPWGAPRVPTGGDYAAGSHEGMCWVLTASRRFGDGQERGLTPACGPAHRVEAIGPATSRDRALEPVDVAQRKQSLAIHRETRKRHSGRTR